MPVSYTHLLQGEGGGGYGPVTSLTAHSLISIVRPRRVIFCKRVEVAGEGTWLTHPFHDEAVEWMGHLAQWLGTSRLYSDQTASTFPTPSAKWNLRPPGNSKVGTTMLPPAATIAASVAFKSAE